MGTTWNSYLHLFNQIYYIMRYRKTITRPLKDKEKSENRYSKNKDKYEIVEIFVDNGYWYEYRELKAPCSEDNREWGKREFYWNKDGAVNSDKKIPVEKSTDKRKGDEPINPPPCKWEIKYRYVAKENEKLKKCMENMKKFYEQVLEVANKENKRLKEKLKEK